MLLTCLLTPEHQCRVSGVQFFVSGVVFHLHHRQMGCTPCLPWSSRFLLFTGLFPKMCFRMTSWGLLVCMKLRPQALSLQREQTSHKKDFPAVVKTPAGPYHFPSLEKQTRSPARYGFLMGAAFRNIALRIFSQLSTCANASLAVSTAAS